MPLIIIEIQQGVYLDPYPQSVKNDVYYIP